MPAPYRSGLVWFRRDLRAHDHAALHHALAQCRTVHCAFVFDRAILDALPRQDRRVEFIQACVAELDQHLRALAGHPQAGLIVLHGWAEQEIPRLALELGVDAVFTHHDDEPAALQRDAAVRTALARARQALHTYKDHMVFERSELLTRTGSPYTVFTPYRKAWLARIDDALLAPWPIQPRPGALAPRPDALCRPVPPLQALGFAPTDLDLRALPAGSSGAQRLLQDFLGRMDRYDQTRDYPALKGPSYLGTHLRFGTISIRELARTALARTRTGSAGASVWLGELIWRDFFFQVLHHHPHVAESSFRPAYDAIAWESGPAAQALFDAWCAGRTGYPLVDAAMAQIRRTGYMHNRLRMVVASFLTKDLGIDWRWGERYFARQLNDYDLAANNGGWQWASSSGCDAQPYFRIFHPVTQSRKFDPQGRFIRRYLPELAALPDAALHAPWEASPLELQAAGVVLGRDYPLPIVDHAAARTRTLQRYAVVKAA
ncbi:cryptochrome/photolyase family protein [Comamonas granuli]|uniref:cryptochrome/photolyase family protein n=1 Tax=Comamonas granuli TaxID=290309 RepID=UPI0005A8B1DB|nr:deoxyribodipyrimidine photo-lyase [Comamonas granuli]